MVDDPSHYSLAQKVATDIQNVLAQPNINLKLNIDLNTNVNFHFFMESQTKVPNWLLIVFVTLMLTFLLPLWQKGNYKNSYHNEKNREGLDLK